MNFDFDDTQYALRDLARDLFAKESPPSRLRELWDGKPLDRRVWKTMAEAGIVGITIPETYGGAGGNEIDMTLVYEEAGRAALPEPLLETTGIAAPMIATYGSDEARERWLPAIANGDVVVAVQGIGETTAAWASEADLFLILGEDFTAHLVERDRVNVAPVASHDPARRIGRVDAELGDDTKMDGVVIPAMHRAFFGSAALLNGVAMHLLEATVAYAKDRQQFGKAIGSFQAVKHKLAKMHVAIESSRPATWFAGYSLANGEPDAGVAACVAKIAASDTEELCNGDALQLHGGIGFTWEHDLHLWLKRGIALRATFGSAAPLRRVLVQAHPLEELL